jgi:hypothetical protein
MSMANSSKKTGQGKPLATPRLRKLRKRTGPHSAQPCAVDKLANMAEKAGKSGAINLAKLAGRNGTFNGRLPTGWGGDVLGIVLAPRPHEKKRRQRFA